MTNKAHRLIAIAFCTATVAPLTSCSDIVFATRTSAGITVSGDATQAPTHVNVGFRRRELIYVGNQAPKDLSLMGKIDSETTWTEGSAIRETLATGAAAEAIADPGTKPTSSYDGGNGKPLTFASRTRVGIGFSAGGSEDDAMPSAYLGYSRRIATRIHTNGTSTDNSVPALVSDVSVHSGPLLGGNSSTSGSVPENATLTNTDPVQTPSGTRIRQFFATGKGAEAVLSNSSADGQTQTAQKLKNEIEQNN